MSTAARIVNELSNLDITLISEKFSPNTTADGAAGIWSPYLVGEETDYEVMRRWCQETHDFFEDLSYTSDSYNAGISQISGCRIYTVKQEDIPFWKNIVHSYSVMTPEDLKRYGPDYCAGARFTTYSAECPRLLPFLMKKFLNSGGHIVRQKIKSLRELTSSYDIIINCTGVEAYHVTPDPAVYPIRGQVMNVVAPWLKTFILDESERGCYIIPNTHTTVLGGTHQENDWNTNVDSKDSNAIWRGCCQLLPSVQNAKVVKQWVGLRPGRYAVRLENETITHNGKTAEVIHNYGHGGSGITLCWGCAGEALKVLKEVLRTRSSTFNSSKL